MTPVKPAPLKPDDRVGLILPASGPIDSVRLISGIAELRRRGLTVVFDDTDLDPVGYLSAPDTKRAECLNAVLLRDDLSTLIAVRGGYGAMRILDAIDYEQAAKHPKLIVGYSDITALQFAFYAMCGWTAVQGPMAAVEWPNIDSSHEAHFWQLVGGKTFTSLAGLGSETLLPIRNGSCEGTLLGGNLAAIVRLIGTRYLPSMEGAILFLEDVGEQPYRIDAMLAQLRLSGHLDTLGGVVLGAFSGCEAAPNRPSFTTEQVFLDYFGNAPYPVAEGLMFGHIVQKISVPVGIRARLEVTDSGATLSMLEAVTAS
jgi:muramoyltetrapeptide carboxypeptidase